jgi:hypothetical protein
MLGEGAAAEEIQKKNKTFPQKRADRYGCSSIDSYFGSAFVFSYAFFKLSGRHHRTAMHAGDSQ